MTVPLFGPPTPDRTRRAGIGSHHAASGITDEWLTPPELLARLGGFDLDPCAPVAKPWRTAATMHDVRDDGLAREWRGCVWLNPPYSTAARWVARLAAHGDGVALVFARTETAWWHETIWPTARAVLFLRGRLTFRRPDGSPGRYNAGGPSALVAWAPCCEARLRAAGDLGKVVTL